MSCDHSHVPLHHQKKNKNKNKSRKIDKRKRKMLVFQHTITSDPFGVSPLKPLLGAMY